ncbi:hypothetical protein CVN68_06320 [Sphingomonas psychrotolerans]|uniref:Uncharacterized protein n=1 Tax=Sphingomonas psychrotolerans TaxID=1327635 RepID=A0A2K8MCK6_9SPHN|nr:hypothetical protein CVN68_06320 [Sphingomonas psychrotolerans]
MFVLTAALADLYLKLPAPIVIEPQSVLLLVGLCLPAMVIGTIVALPINGVGALAMLAFGGSFAPARSRTAWALAGGILGGVGVWLFETDANFSFAVVATSVFCGWLSSWSDAGIADA